MNLLNDFNTVDSPLETYHLMFKDEPVLTVSDENVQILKRNLLPLPLRPYRNISYAKLLIWLNERVTPISRANMKTLFNIMGISQVSKLEAVYLTKGLSLTDCYWYKKKEDESTWEEVNLFNNKFSDAIGLVAFTGRSNFTIQNELRNSKELTGELMLQGAYSKRWLRDDDSSQGSDIYLVKASTDNGKESEAEYIVSEILKQVDIDHVEYELIEYQGRTATKCKCITNEEISLVPFAHLDSFMTTQGMDAVHYVSKTYPNEFYKMLIIDYVVNNVDRHNYNWGLLMDNSTGGLIGLHSLLDHNNCLSLSEQEQGSLIYDGKTMKQVAQLSTKKIDSQPFLEQLNNALQSKEIKKLFSRYFKSDESRIQCLQRLQTLMPNLDKPNNITEDFRKQD